VSQIWNNILDVFERALGGLEQLFSFTGAASWGWAIIGLTLVIRILLLPLAIKQIRSMRAMQAIQPQMKAIQKKYKVDRDLMKKDPEQYKAKKQKMNEEMMALYQAEGVNPAASCLPLLAQAPVFFALFSILRGDRANELVGESFYFFTMLVPDEGLTALVSAAGWPGWLLVILMAATMFVSQKQVMARQSATGGDNPMAQQQKVLLYVMPVFLAFISFNLPLGVLLYWVTTNAWQAGQQAIMLREVQHEVEEGTLAEHPGGEAAAIRPGKTGKGGSSGKPARGGLLGRLGLGRGEREEPGPVVPPTTGGGQTGRRNPGATSGGTTDEPAAGSPPPTPKPGAAEPKPKKGGKAGPGGPPASGSANGSPKGPAKGSSKAGKNRDHLPRRR
jgi:YidC/Oxa1 family membrane protein insertase